jgi:hypothetical protein
MSVTSMHERAGVVHGEVLMMVLMMIGEHESALIDVCMCCILSLLGPLQGALGDLGVCM